MTSPAASIVVPTRGGAKRLPMLFDALRAQSLDDFEVIVVVDGDVDDSASVVAQAASTLPVRSVAFPENRGRSAALNAGFSAARGGVLIRCDDDLVPGPDYVAGHVARHEGDACGVVGIYRNVYRPSSYVRAYGRARDVRFREDAYLVRAERRWQYWAGNVSVTRETFGLVGEYDTGFRAYGWEDVDWGYRLHRVGLPVVLAPELETVHTGSAPTTAIRVDKAFHSGAARTRFVAKHGSAMFDRIGASPGRGAWGALVGAASGALGRRNLVMLGRGVDAVSDYVPKWAAEKLISLLVESGSLSGRRRVTDVTADI